MSVAAGGALWREEGYEGPYMYSPWRHMHGRICRCYSTAVTVVILVSYCYSTAVHYLPM